MSSQLAPLRLHKKLPPSLRNDFWKDFMDAVEEELLRLKAVVAIKEDIYNISAMSYDRLIEVSDLLGVIFDTTIDGSIEFLRQEVEAISFKIKNKSTAKLYQSFFKAVSREGELAIYYYKTSSDAIVRSMYPVLEGIEAHDWTKPYRHQSDNNFTGSYSQSLRLDDGLLLDIENEGEFWTLDTATSEISTNHIALEYVIDRVITKQVRDSNYNLVTKEFLQTWQYHDFIEVNMDFGRRVKEVPHIGSQLYLIGDSSGHYDTYGHEYTMPDIKANVVINPANFSSLASAFDLSYMEFGIGKHESLPSKDGSGSMPTDLMQRVARSYVLFDEKDDRADWTGVVGEYKGQMINRFALHDNTGYVLDNDPSASGVVDGANDDFTGTLLFAPIRPKNVRFRIVHGEAEYIIQDDGKGNLSGSVAYGDIDYVTGKYSFSTNIDFEKEVEVGVGDGVGTVFEFTTEESERPLVPGSLKFYYRAGLKYIATDDGSGIISGPYCNGTVDYSLGEVRLVFDLPVDANEPVTMAYAFPKRSTPDAETEIRVDYYFTHTPIEITEVGLYDINDTLIAYATFPPIEFTKAKNHVNIAIALKKTPFV